MKQLIELVDLISSQKTKSISVVPSPYSNTKINQLYNKIENGEITSELDILDHFYQGRDNQKKNAARLKNKLKDRLINTLFFIDVNHFSKSPYEIAIHKINRNTAAFNILFDRTRRNTAVNLGEKTINLAIKYDALENVIVISKRLRNHYTVYDYNKRKKRYYTGIMTKYLKFYHQVIHAEDLYIELAHAVLHNKDISGIRNEHKESLVEILHNQQSNTNYFFNFYAYNAMYLIKLSERNFEELVKLTEEAIKFFAEKEGFSPIAVFDLTFKKGYALLNLGQVEEALKTFEVCKEMGPTEGNISWYNIHAYICMTAIILKNYSYAIEILNIALIHKGFNKLHETFKEPWLIKEAYLNFLIKMNKINENDVEKSMRTFKMGRFLNEVPLYSKDKRGYNIAILIIQMLFFLMDRKYSKFIDRMDALNQYSYRYLRNDDTLRSNCFVKMILKIPDATYHPERLKRHTKKLYKTLINTPPDIREQSSNIEIIPYESLWDLVLELLDKQRKKS